jgi:hypothetical protein
MTTLGAAQEDSSNTDTAIHRFSDKPGGSLNLTSPICPEIFHNEWFATPPFMPHRPHLFYHTSCCCIRAPACLLLVQSSHHEADHGPALRTGYLKHAFPEAHCQQFLFLGGGHRVPKTFKILNNNSAGS